MTSKQRPLGSNKIRRAYAFLVAAEHDGRAFTRQELAEASGWTEKTTAANLSKKLGTVVHRASGGYRASGVARLTEDGFCRLCSQNVALASDPYRPVLTGTVEELVLKARETVLAAVQHYNNPTALSRSGTYIVLMVIGYTALFHGIFERDGVDYAERREDGTPKLTGDGEPYHWDAVRGARYYAQHYADRYEPGMLTAMAKNLEFIFPIRHRIEHRQMPQLDVDIAGHCQAMLLNFEQILTQEFTFYYALNPSLNLALQFSTRRSPGIVTTLKRLQAAEYEALREYISRYHASLPDEIAGNPAFEFRVWLIQKPANRERNADLSIEFVRTDQLSDEDRARFQQAIVAIKGVPVALDPSKECNMWEGEVVERVRDRIGGEVEFGDQRRPLTNTMIRWVRDAHNIPNPSKMYYRPDRDGSRAMYSPAFIDWIVEQYQKDRDFFFKARLSVVNK